MTLLAVAAVSLSVATMIVTIATVKGFQNGIREKIVKVHGNFIIDHAANVEGAEPLLIAPEYLPSRSDLPQFKRMAISISKACIVKAEDDIDGAIAKGMLREDVEYSMGDFFRYQQEANHRESLQPWVYISQTLANRLKLDTGELFTMVFFVRDSSGQQRPRAVRVNIVGIYETGIEEIDKQLLYTDIKLVQKYSEIKGAFSQIECWQANNSPLKLSEISKQLTAGVLRVSDSSQFNRLIYDWLAILNTNVWIILVLMSVVAIIAMSTILLILIVEKTSFIGISQAMGANISQIQRIFLWQSGFIVFAGLLIGDAIAISLCLLQEKTHWLSLNQEVYFVKYVMVDINVMAILIVNSSVLLASLLAAIVPVQWIKRMTPTQAIRFQ